MATKNMLLAGFGGQGILFAAKVIAYAGLLEEKQVSWLPSYGPEMRGGTANCSVCISDEPIGSPLVLNPDILVVMNIQSFDKFIDKVVPGGTAIVDSSLIDKKTNRDDIHVYYIDATKQANDDGLTGLANIIMIGKMLAATSFSTEEMIEKALQKCIPAKKAHLLEPNMKAIKLGMSL